ncbi:MAG: lysophospholipid transporter LplT [Pseudomonadota bacterium]|nr:lysophospholipid transporter LplT [Pseudomonadota bacterium]
MKQGFGTIMSAQFVSALADTALGVVALELLRADNMASRVAWLAPMLALFYVLLAPFLGAFADAWPKGRVMLLANTVKMVGCLMMLVGVNPLVAYAVVGLGAAAYSPAKYGIVIELLPASQLVRANGWIEGLTIVSIILGIAFGGFLVGPTMSRHLLALDVPLHWETLRTGPETALGVLAVLYVVAAAITLRIPRTDAPLQPLDQGVAGMLRDFVDCNGRLWADRLGQISLATTTLFWGASANLKNIVFAWAAVALGYNTSHTSALILVLAVGTAGGAVLASMRVRLDQAMQVLPLGVGMGLLVIALSLVRSPWAAAPVLLVLGGVGGYLVVPMNALLYHRGATLMGAGRSLAVQNFNEQSCILGFAAFYITMTRLGLTAVSAVAVFGLLVAGAMGLVLRWHRANHYKYPQELGHLLAVARSEAPH